MSHVACVELEVNDMEALEETCKELGWNLKRGQKTYKWFGRWVNDYSAGDAAYHHGIDPKDYGKCDHAISIPGINYEVGLVQKPTGKPGQYVVIFDFFDQALKDALGGQGAPKLIQHYGVKKVTAECQKKGYKVTHTKTKTGDIQLVIAGKF